MVIKVFINGQPVPSCYVTVKPAPLTVAQSRDLWRYRNIKAATVSRSDKESKS